MQVTETICAELFNRFNHGHRATWVQPGVGPTTFIIWQVASVLIATVTCMLPALLTSHWSVPSRHAPEWKKSELDTDFVTVIAAVQAPSVDAWELDRRWAAQATGTSIYQQDIKGQPPSATLCGLGGCATKLLANPMVFAMQCLTGTAGVCFQRSEAAAVEVPVTSLNTKTQAKQNDYAAYVCSRIQLFAQTEMHC
ncbi:uncharacterized protein LOC144114738 isoform X4 [Amblyomma americanum]